MVSASAQITLAKRSLFMHIAYILTWDKRCVDIEYCAFVYIHYISIGRRKIRMYSSLVVDKRTQVSSFYFAISNLLLRVNKFLSSSKL